MRTMNVICPSGGNGVCCTACRRSAGHRAQTAVMRLRCDTDDFEVCGRWHAEVNALADRIALRKPRPGEEVADHHDRQCAGRVAILEVASAQHANPHGFQERRAGVEHARHRGARSIHLNGDVRGRRR